MKCVYALKLLDNGYAQYIVNRQGYMRSYLFLEIGEIRRTVWLNAAWQVQNVSRYVRWEKRTAPP